MNNTFKYQMNYEFRDLVPCLSEVAVSIHIKRHHSVYADKLNYLIRGTEFENMPLEKIIIESRHSNSDIFNNASQLFNHNFYWASLIRKSMLQDGYLMKQIVDQFESFEDFRDLYVKHANKIFGSGWSWLCANKEDHSLFFENTQNAENFVGNDHVEPICVIDLWEHAYYVDYRGYRLDYLNNIVNRCMNWDFCSSNFSKLFDKA